MLATLLIASQLGFAPIAESPTAQKPLLASSSIGLHIGVGPRVRYCPPPVYVAPQYYYYPAYPYYYGAPVYAVPAPVPVIPAPGASFSIEKHHHHKHHKHHSSKK